ncbi:outer membrane protein assembly factor BamD [Weeksella virosa]|uniref:Outer membrane assembly lipoprotein YfiO n=1 Tax=Weeksella virosa (strain ATCC 43766 / DSM 16922 / JCM 21250 / CCUG 30538 / CDC 9751 / IAM 14551 / NBRC 16016 / NCTC 11634 / CL345/78) TaxID=865938 RepID=F0P1H2_WEEVC|nr:outer membrane protein assembly factor BamD [Weeksella virosa]ADX68686.1 outer membrane assembly lipoprotein YfiO [Weeksella virosa DSM 16922]MDK7375150.1 outer membrane protein assembly factor BamD [Weeksella virosa]MDK7675825.1 outer membrane protein assembly factor BamD [Weeksella virosa]SUP55034.1 tol-pal system protein YbgF [Weeksella virosa]VEH63645.1 tol-pal system protein YbgF [Weeksella virosa]
MFKKVSLTFLVATMLTSCNTQYNKAMKSSDKDEIFSIANTLFEQGKYDLALELYNRISTSFVGTEKAADIAYNIAQANYNDENYRLSGHLFKNFAGTYPLDHRAEDALYLSAFSYYKDSPRYNLDQTSTYNAIDEMQNFINTYPESEHVAQANEYIDELRGKLEKKAFEIARVYYKTMKYKAAGVAFDNMVDDFPDSKYREEAMLYSLRSKAELAMNFSRLEHKELRLQEALTQYKLFSRLYPESSFKSEAEKINTSLAKAINDFDKVKAQIDMHKEAQEAKDRNVQYNLDNQTVN